MWGIAVIVAACCLAFGAVDAAAKMREKKQVAANPESDPESTITSEESPLVLDCEQPLKPEWLSREDLPDDEDYSLTREMMGVLRKGEETKCPLAFYR